MGVRLHLVCRNGEAEADGVQRLNGPAKIYPLGRSIVLASGVSQGSSQPFGQVSV